MRPRCAGRNRWSRPFALVLVSLLLPTHRVQAQAAPAAPRPVPLAQALGALPPDTLPEGTTLLSVGADRVFPPAPPASGTAPDAAQVPGPPEDASDAAPTDTGPLGAAVTAYGRTLLTFGHVEALAPATMTVLNTDPNLANLPLADLVTQSPLPFLLGTLTPDQWQKLSSGSGLGVADMSADQQGLLRAALPSPLKVAPTSTSPPSLDADTINTWTPDDWARFNKERAAAQKIRDAQTQVVPDDILARDGRLRLFLASQFVFDVPGQGGYGIGVAPGGRDAPKTNTFELTDTWTLQRQAGDKLSRYVKASTPNEPKDGDLRWARHELGAKIALDKLKTVDDLVARLAQATGLELYADASYGSQTLAVVGDAAHPQQARDVMQALALCVCGAWRQVGPAWILTDDVEGLATRRANLKEITDIWSDRLRRASEGVGDHLDALHWAQTLPFTPGDPAALPDALRAKAATPGDGGFGAGINLQDLPPATQAGLRTGLREYAGGKDLNASATKIQSSLTPQTPVHVSFSLRFALDLPGFGTLPLDVNPYRPQRTRHDSSPNAPTDGPPRAPDRLTLTEARRAILCAPATPDQARAVVDKIAAMGFNTLFCDVPIAEQPDATPSLLAAAIREGAQKRVAVYAVLDAFCWRRDAGTAHPQPLPDGVGEDVTLQGQTMSQAVEQRLNGGHVRDGFQRGFLEVEGHRRWVSPIAPPVRARLTEVVQTVAAVPGLAGLAFQDTTPPGYLGGGDTGSELNVELGYTLEQRLAYLRAHHADPIDIGSWRETYLEVDGGGSDRTSLQSDIPGFGGTFGGNSDAWDKWRGDEAQALMAYVWTAAHQAAPRLPLWMREQRIGFSFDPWTDPKKPNKADSLRSEGNALANRVTKDTILAVLYPGWPDDLAELSFAIREFRQQFSGGKASGILLDLTAEGAGTNPLRALDRLAPLFAPADALFPKPTP